MYYCCNYNEFGGFLKKVNRFPCETTELLCKRLCGGVSKMYNTYAEQVCKLYPERYAVLDDVVYEKVQYACDDAEYCYISDGAHIEVHKTPLVGERYRYFNGNIVRVIAVTKHTETEEPMVCYVYGGDSWVCSLSVFFGNVDKDKYPDVVQKKRFELIV